MDFFTFCLFFSCRKQLFSRFSDVGDVVTMNTGPVDTVIHVGFQVGNSVRLSMVPYLLVIQGNKTRVVKFFL
jgi:hypothetical protein